MKKILLPFLLVLLCSCNQKDSTVLTPDEMAMENRADILQGWNTWDNRSVMTHVYMPDELALVMHLKDGESGEVLRLSFPGNVVKGTEHIRTIAHTPDGSYTDFTMTWKNMDVRFQTVAEKENLYIRVKNNMGATEGDELMLMHDFFYNTEGSIKREKGEILASVNGKEFRTQMLNGLARDFGEDALSAPIKDAVYIVCGKVIDAKKIDEKILKAQHEWTARLTEYGDYAESFNAIQNAANWTMVYDHREKQPVNPVARPWAYGWGNREAGGWVRFCWDNFFVAYMHAMTNKKMAYSEAIEMCNYIDDYGMVPNFIGPGGIASRDRSQPPVGSMMIREIFKIHREKWFLEKTFDQLLKWNRWWKDNRDQDGYLAWGSNDPAATSGDFREEVHNEYRAARYESGLDNSPMFDGVPFDTTIHMLLQADVGLMGMYVGDCEALADIAAELGKTEEEEELRERAELYRSSLKTMWDEEFGLFLNKRTDTGELSRRITPTNFYALIAKAATQEQAERMINEHFYNEDEFWGEYIMPSCARNDTAYTGQDYWRGSIWAPMNFLVYIGMCNYEHPQARKDLSEKSKELLLQEWFNNAWIRENYHAETGNAPPARSTHFYHWGALLGMINMVEEGFVPPLEAEIN